MKKRYAHKTIEYLFGVLAIALYTAVFFFAWRTTYLESIDIPYYWKGKLMLILAYAGIVSFFLNYFDGFTAGVLRVRDVVFSHYSALLAADLSAFCLLIFLNRGISDPLPILYVLVIQSVLATAWAYFANRLYYRYYKKRSTIIFYNRESDLKRLNAVPYFDLKYTVKNRLKVPIDLEEASGALEGAECVFIVGVDASQRNAIIEMSSAAHVSMITIPQIGDILLDGARTVCIDGNIYMKTDVLSHSPIYLAVKRLFDIVASVLALAVLSPLFAVVAICIRCGDGGPAIYRQTRLTVDGKTFTMYKFRSMNVDAEQDKVARLATEDDSRITAIGAFIRKHRIDELPQLVNVLMGDMSVVGPRPERPEISALYEKLLPSFSLRLQVKAGLTGYAQVYGRYNTEPYEKLQMDLMYINRMSAFEDIKLIMNTVKILFSKDASAGVEDGHITAVRDEETVGMR